MSSASSVKEKPSLLFPSALAVILGLVFLLPDLLMPALQGPECLYTPFSTSTFEVEETFYASAVREVFDGTLLVSDPQLFERKGLPNHLSRLPFLVLGLLARLLGSVPRVYMAGDFFFPAVIFLLVYTLLHSWTRDSWVSGMAGAAVLLGYHLVPYIPLKPDLIVSQLINYEHGIRPIERFSRLPYNQFSFTVLMTAVVVLYRALAGERNRLVIPAGIAAGSIFYTYFYHLTFFSFAGGLLLVLFALRGERRLALRMLGILAVMTLTAVPFLLSAARFSRLPQYMDVMTRIGIEVKKVTFFQVFVTCQVTGYLFLGWVVAKKKNLPFYFLSCFLGAGILCYWMKAVLGFSVLPHHWSIGAIDPFIVMYLCLLFWHAQRSEYRWSVARHLASALSRHRKGIAFGVILFFIVFGIYTHTRYSLNAYPYFCLKPAMEKAYRWLDTHTDKESVVGSDSIHTINALPAYTHCNNFAPAGFMTSAPSSEIIDRICILYRVYQVPEEYLQKVLSADNMLVDLITSFPRKKMTDEDMELAYWSGTLFSAKFAFAPYNADQPYRFPPEIKEKIARGFTLYVPLDVREEIISRFRYYQDRPIDTALERYRMDYLFFGPHEKRISKPDFTRSGRFQCVYDQDEIQVYRVKKGP